MLLDRLTVHILRKLGRQGALVITVASRYDLRRVVHTEEVVRGIEQRVVERTADGDERCVHVRSNTDDVFYVEVLEHGQRESSI